MGNLLTVIPLPESFLNAPIAHRGLHDCGGMFGSGRSENSIAAFSSAIERGYGIEVDIQLSADAAIIGLSDIKITNQHHYMVRALPCRTPRPPR